jgi:membrane protein required for colicin V production
MNIVDWCVLGFVAASMLLGILRGGTKEVLGLGGWVGGLIVAFFAAPLLAPLLESTIPASNLRWAAAFGILFIAVRLVAWGIGKLAAEIIVAAKLGFLDRLLGAFFGVFRAVVVSLVVAFLCMMTAIPSTTTWQGSTIAPIAKNVVIALTPYLPAHAQRWIEANPKLELKNKPKV